MGRSASVQAPRAPPGPSPLSAFSSKECTSTWRPGRSLNCITLTATKSGRAQLPVLAPMNLKYRPGDNPCGVRWDVNQRPEGSPLNTRQASPSVQLAPSCGLRLGAFDGLGDCTEEDLASLSPRPAYPASICEAVHDARVEVGIDTRLQTPCDHGQASRGWARANRRQAGGPRAADW